MSVTPSCARIDPSTISTIECTTDWGCTTMSIRSGGTSNSHRASMTSSPLLMSVAESIVIFRPIRHVGCFSASGGATAASASAEWPRNGPPDAVRINRLISCDGRPCTHWWTALCSLSTGRISTPRRRAASVTSAPAITSTSLFASAIVFPASIAASTASSAAVPDEAHSTMSTSGRVASATRPSDPWPAISVAAALPCRRSRSTAAPDAMATARGRNCPTCSANSATLAPAAIATTSSLSGCDWTTDRALRPIDPVDPRIARRLTTAT